MKYGKIHIPAKAFKPKNQKIRITTMIDGDVLDALKKTAAQHGNKGYQTVLNEILRESLLGEETVENRLKRLESIVLKKTA